MGYLPYQMVQDFVHQQYHGNLYEATSISDERNRLAGASGLLLAVKGGKTEVIFVGIGEDWGGPKNSEPLKKWGL